MQDVAIRILAQSNHHGERPRNCPLSHWNGVFVVVVLVVFFVFIFIFIIVIIVGVAGRHEGEGIGDQQPEVFRDARGHFVAPRMWAFGNYRTESRVAARPLTICNSLLP
jgi:hypothetical protein